MSRRRGLALAAGVVAFAIVTTLVGMASGAPIQFLVLDLVTGLSFVVAGLAAVWLRPGSPAGPALLVSGALWYVGSYAPSGQPVVTYLGFAFEAYYDLVLAALLLVLSSPTQRLEPRWLIAALAAAMAVRSLGRLILLDPVRLFDCADCPPNPFALWPNLAAFEAVEIASNLAIAGLAALVGLVVLRRLLTSGPIWRRIRWPILVAGGLAMGSAAFDRFEYAWTTATQAPLVELAEPWSEVFGWLMFGLRTLVPIGFLLATLRIRSAPGPLGPFAAGLERPGGEGRMGDALRTALGDQSLQLLRPAESGTWSAEDGSEASLTGAVPGRAMTLVGPADQPLAAIVHDPALLEQRELLEAVVRVLRLALENERLELELREQLQAVTESRARIVTAAEEERRRVERDLHDGAQQRLVAVMLALQQARRTADTEAVPEALRSELDAAARETTEAVRELRELARGIHPAILEDEGLGAAVAALARRAGIPVDVRLELDGRLPR
ncbi:MAG TPA: histidine kinase dimerization/phosphoacceptor domain-containing protein, partial [Candidatus Binatia bacterium]|nr:histidine kinase dimerization/phosphoacceptor domain-containing protein [Candidatus Binatia bacterium]